ncbi:hypothetical protein CQA53_05785 [Helicobacter didelphidarum]|uniref:RelA/SpoT domain-containing protein n=1 Tax=Helicobacter didelphidarum TaxID=2040648 RepID=A0A3D8IL03_9HELI|nr:hypothetical protein [Helicobacter didelphidarum]RDU65803.1 hypothetical protein CQA53_05785 [Helicobacter didelphidarum]
MISKTQLDKIGASIRQEEDNIINSNHKKIIDEWRNQHLYFKKILMDNINNLLKNNFTFSFSSRLKRYSSIKRKLRESSTRLTQMQDILGFRIVTDNNLQNVYMIKDILENSFKQNTEFIFDTVDDYIQQPKEDGYRCLHLIIKVQNRYYVEIQIKTKLQHLWATSLEVISTIKDKDFKHEYKNDQLNLFFKNISQIIDWHENYSSKMQITLKSKVKIIKILYSKYLKEIEVISKYSSNIKEVLDALKIDNKKIPKNIIFTLDVNRAIDAIEGKGSDNILKINAFDSEKEALTSYNQRELKRYKDGADIVLISSYSLDDLEKNYPNYYLDCDEFIRCIKDIAQQYTNSFERIIFRLLNLFF